MWTEQTALAGYYDIDPKTEYKAVPAAQWTQRFDRARQVQRDFKVGTLDDFVEMNAYYGKFVNDGVAVSRFTTALGDDIACIDVATQQSLLASGAGRPLDLPPASPAGEKPTKGQDAKTIGARQGLDGTLDALGNMRACPEGTFPKVIFPIADLYRFRTLEDFFRKTPGGAPELPPAPKSGAATPFAATSHEYAYAGRFNIDNWGLSADFNVWSPAVARTSEFSLSQLWVSRGAGSDLQTAETGWQVFNDKYGDNRARLFAYSTSDGYRSNSFASGCYNLDCGRFVQFDNHIALASAFTNYSSTDGPQFQVTLQFIRDSTPRHNWWLKVGDTWVGYYPNSLFDAAGIADVNDQLEFGGEIINNQTDGVDTHTDMGSGAFPGLGFGKAAYIKHIRYVDLTFNYATATGLRAFSTIPGDWNISPIFSSGDPDWTTYFFFGGPGTNPAFNSLAVSASPAVGGTVSGGGTFAYGSNRTVFATANAGYTFRTWTENGAFRSILPNYTFALTGDTNLVANFQPDITVSVSASPATGGTVSGGGIYHSASSPTVTATANTGYRFVNWSDDGFPVSTSESYTLLAPTSDQTLVANFIPLNYALTVRASPPAGGTVSGGGTFPFGSSHTVRAIPSSGYSFVSWTDGDSLVSTSANYTFTITGDRALAANFVKKTYTVRVTSAPTARGAVSGGGTFLGGTSHTVSATPKPGFRFLNWSENDAQVSALKNYTFTVTGNRRLLAKFGAAHVAQNDILADLGSSGLFEYLENTTWMMIHTLSPSAMTSGDLNGNGKDEAVVALSTGFWAHFDNNRWIKINAKTPLHIAIGDIDNTGQDDVVADFAGLGIYALVNNIAPWVKLNAAVSLGLATGDLDGNRKADVLAALSTGLWARFDSGQWVKIHPKRPLQIVTGDLDGDGRDDVVADFSGQGIYARMNNSGPWVKLNASVSNGLAIGDLNGNGKDDILAILPTGLWARHDDGQWQKLDPRQPLHVISVDLDDNGKDDIVADFSGSGIFARKNGAATWIKLRADVSQGLAAGGLN